MNRILFQAGVQGGKDETVKTVQPVRRDAEDAANAVITLERNLK
jgi:hypothetical protein